MGEKNLGFCGSSVRFLLIIVNCVFLLMGLIVFIIAAVLKWTTIFNTFVNIKEIETLVKLGEIESVTTLLLIVSVFAIIVSILGILGAKFSNRFFLIIYEIILVLLFLTHGIAALVVAVGSTSLENGFKEAMNKTVNTLNSNETMPDVYERECQLMHDISELFKCCGGSGPFENENVTMACCTSDSTDVGCTDKVINDVVKYSVHLIVIPSVIILLIEFFAIVTVPFLICRVSKRNGYEAY